MDPFRLSVLEASTVKLARLTLINSLFLSQSVFFLILRSACSGFIKSISKKIILCSEKESELSIVDEL